jgi:hypothetical protein
VKIGWAGDGEGAKKRFRKLEFAVENHAKKVDLDAKSTR